MSREHWKNQAENWLAWARTPGFDAYWTYSPTFFQLVPEPRGRTLEVGCGEGRVSRDLVSRGHRVTAVDATPLLIKMATESDANSSYLTCDAAALPFADASFDLVVFYNSLMDVDDMQGSLHEAARVLRREGKVCACVTHPISDAGVFESREPDAPFVISGAYLGPRRWLEIPVVERDGLRMDFSGWAYSLEHYFMGLERAGFVVEALREPPYADGAPDEPSDERWRRIPNFLMWRATKL